VWFAQTALRPAVIRRATASASNAMRRGAASKRQPLTLAVPPSIVPMTTYVATIRTL
jgi:hypothetical protein